MTENPKETGRRPVFFRRRDLVVILIVLAIALVLWLVFAQRQPPGAVAGVSIGLGDAQRQVEIPLAPDAIHPLEAELTVQLEVKDGAIRFIHSVCPDHTCEDFGWLRHEGDWAACLPAGVVVRIAE